MQVLIVEDDLVIRSLLKVKINRQFLDSIPLEIESVAKISEALKVTFSPDVIILDLGLEDSDAEETITHIPALTKNASVIVVSNGLSDEITKKCYEAGAQEVIDKTTLSIGSIKERLILAHYYKLYGINNAHKA